MSAAQQILNQASNKREDRKYQFKIEDTPDYRLDKDVTTISASDLSNFKEEPKEMRDKSNAMAFAFKLGISDTLRGLSQITGLGFDKDEMKKEQKQLHQLMEEHGGLVTGAYFVGALLDPATWLLPFTKAKTIYQMGKYGMVSGAVAGATGYVDEDSYFNTRTKQAGAGAIGGGIVAPGLGILKNIGVKVTGKGTKIPLTDRPEPFDYLSDRVHKMNMTTDDAIALGLQTVKAEGKLISPTTKELVDEGFKGKKIIQKTGPDRTFYIRPADQIPYSKPPKIEPIKSSLNIKKSQFKSKLDDPKFKVEDPTKRDASGRLVDQLVRGERELEDIAINYKYQTGHLRKGPIYYFNQFVATPYREKFGKKLWQKVSTTGEGGLSAAGGVIGFAGAYDQPYVSVDNPFMSKLGRGFLGALTGYATAKGMKVKTSTLKGLIKGTTQPVKTKIGPADEELYLDETIGQFFARGFLDLFSRDYKLIKNKSIGQENSIINSFDAINKNLLKLSPQERIVTTLLAAGDISAAAVRNKTLQKIAKDQRDLISHFMQRMVDLGVLKQATFDRNVNTYLSRLYLDMSEDAIDFKQVADALKVRGIRLSVTPDEYLKVYKNQKFYEEDGRTIKKVMGGTRDKPELIPHRGWELPPGVTVKDLETKKGIEALKAKGFIDEEGYVSIRADMTKAERVAKDEIEDVALLINQTMRIQASAIGNAKFYDYMARRYAVNKRLKKYRNLSESQMLEKFDLYKIPTTKLGDAESAVFRYGNLAGRYVPREIFVDVVQRQKYLEKKHGALFRSFRSLNRLWKASKTAWNPTVHVNNVMGNFVFTDFADVSFTNLPESAKILWKASRDEDYRSEIIIQARQHGVFDAGFVDKELKNISQEAWSKIYRYNNKTNEMENAVSISGRLFSAVRKNFITNNAEDVYRLEDHVFRLNAFIDRLQKNYSADEAALFARKQFVDYDIQAPVINYLRHTVTPFLAFTYRVVPILAETAVLRPWKFAKYGALGYTLNKAGEMFGDGDPEKERAIMEADKYKGGKILNLPFMPYKNLKLPVKTETGESKYLFIERYFPGGDIFEMGTGNIGFLPAPLTISAGIAGDVISSIIGYDMFLNKTIEGRGLSGGQDLVSILGSIGSKLIPNFPFVPGSFATNRINRATRGGEESLFIDEESELIAIANSVGIKINNVTVKKLKRKLKAQITKEVKYYQKKIKELHKKLQTGEISKARYDKKRAGYMNDIRNVMREYNLRIEGYDPRLIKEPDFVLKMLGNNAELDIKTGQEYQKNK